MIKWQQLTLLQPTTNYSTNIYKSRELFLPIFSRSSLDLMMDAMLLPLAHPYEAPHARIVSRSDCCTWSIPWFPSTSSNLC